MRRPCCFLIIPFPLLLIHTHTCSASRATTRSLSLDASNSDMDYICQIRDYLIKHVCCYMSLNKQGEYLSIIEPFWPEAADFSPFLAAEISTFLIWPEDLFCTPSPSEASILPKTWRMWIQHHWTASEQRCLMIAYAGGQADFIAPARCYIYCMINMLMTQ